jgi:UDP-N-acetylmuramoylalanine--D-glutamate ligase
MNVDADNFFPVAGARVLVVGLARSGLAAARFLVRRGAVVAATDRAPAEALAAAAAELAALGVELHLGGHPAAAFEAAEAIVLSPGVPHELPVLARARARGVPVVGELELAGRFIREPIVAVSGTNGKTTVTEMIGRMLAASGRRVFVGGNIGTPLIGYADRPEPAEVVVAEVSSFQLDTIVRFRPDVAVLLNITDDHLDRYADFEAYVRSKMRLFENQTAADAAVLNGADPAIRPRAAAIRARRLFYNAAGDPEAAAELAGGALRVRLPSGAAHAFTLEGFRLKGPHNLENAAAAALAALAAGASPAGVQETLTTFAGLPHRLETVATVGGVAYVNDSKATNVDAVQRALECFERPVVLIMGGLDKGGDFTQLAAAVRARVKRLILIGAAAGKIGAALAGSAPAAAAASMAEAVRRAAESARPGEAVLLSPGCASFDMYANYAARGEDFRRAVAALEAGEPAGARPESGAR